MSEENVEVAYRASDAFKRRDLDAFLALCDPDVEFVSYLVQVEGGGPYRGHDGVRSWWDRLLGVYPDFSFEVEETRDVGDLTIARIRVHGHGVESDAPMEQAVWLTAEFSHGKIIWWRFVPSEAEALEAARSSEAKPAAEHELRCARSPAAASSASSSSGHPCSLARSVNS